MHSTSQPKQWHKASDTAMATSTHCTKTASRTGTDNSMPLSSPIDTCRDHPPDACVPFDLDICNPTVDASQSTHATGVDTAMAVTARDKPHPAVTKRPVRLHQRPARFLETIQARRLVNRNSASRAPCRAACCDVTAAGSCQSGCSARVVRMCRVVRCRYSCTKSFACLRSVDDMPRSSIFRSERFASTSASSEAGSGPGMALDRTFIPRSIEGHQGFSRSVADEGYGGDQDRAGGGAPAGGPTRRRLGTNRTAPTVEFPPSAARIVRRVVCFTRDRPTLVT